MLIELRNCEISSQVYLKFPNIELTDIIHEHQKQIEKLMNLAEYTRQMAEYLILLKNYCEQETLTWYAFRKMFGE